MYDSSNHVTGKTGLSPTVVVRKEGGSFATPSGAVSEIGNGFYKVAGNTTDTNTLGGLVLSATASGADQATQGFQIVAFDPLSATNLGLSFISAAVALASELAKVPRQGAGPFIHTNTDTSETATVAIT